MCRAQHSLRCGTAPKAAQPEEFGEERGVFSVWGSGTLSLLGRFFYFFLFD